MEHSDELDFAEYYIKFLRDRITELRMAKGVSEREMSLSLGKGASFVNQIVSGKNVPYFENFFEICEYFKVTPEEFFRSGENPVVNSRLYEELSRCENGPQKLLNIISRMKTEQLEALLNAFDNF